MTKQEIIDNLELYTVGRLKKDQVSITVEELQNLIDEIKKLDQDTVSREAYTSEHFARKDAEYELWKIKEQQSSDDYEYNRGYRDGYDKGNLNGYELRKSEEKKYKLF